ncbi:MAG: deaminase [Bradyrhizobiaceae bacterium]|nr:deaminase [Bradyrhizobiaceae bacterium]
MSVTTFNSPTGPQAVGPYSHGVIARGELVFLSGQIPLLANGTMVVGDCTEQTRQVFYNIKEVLSSQGLGLNDVVKCTVFLASMEDFAAMNAVYGEAFGDHRPARSAFQVARLPKDALVEIEVIACRS